MSTLLTAAPVAATSNVRSSDLTVADRIIELWALFLLELPTVGTAW